jgi:sigma-B regulation protein RsbU (phosphoserine phosphatase)
MQTFRTMANHSFEMLANSKDFLSIVLNNINSCVLLLDRQLRLQAFNNALRTIFPHNSTEDIHYMRCGEAIGCAYQIEESKDCGKTSKCSTCELRLAGMESYLNNTEIFREHIVRPFFDQNKERVMKTLQFSTRGFHFQHERYIIMIIEDISAFHKNSTATA